MRNLNVHSAMLLTGLLITLTVSLSACDLMKQLPFLNNPANTSGDAAGKPAAGPADAARVKAHINKGNALAKQGKWEEADAEFAQALALDHHHTQAHVQSGWMKAELKQWDAAQNHLLQAISNEPNNASAHANLAWVYAEKKRWHDAQTEAKKAIDLDPKNSYPHATLAWAYQESNQPELAIAEYEKSLELNPALDNSRLAVGILYCNTGRASQAQKHLGHLSKFKSPKVAELQERLRKGCGKK